MTPVRAAANWSAGTSLLGVCLACRVCLRVRDLGVGDRPGAGQRVRAAGGLWGDDPGRGSDVRGADGTDAPSRSVPGTSLVRWSLAKPEGPACTGWAATSYDRYCTAGQKPQQKQTNTKNGDG